MDLKHHMKEQVELIEKAVSCTLGPSETDFTVIKCTGSSAIALTMPTITQDMAGQEFRVINATTSTVTIIEDWGGISAVTITLAQGQMAIIYCDGSYWYYSHHTAAA